MFRHVLVAVTAIIRASSFYKAKTSHYIKLYCTHPVKSTFTAGA